MARNHMPFVRLRLEPLEDRLALAVTPVGDLAENNASAWRPFASDGRASSVVNSAVNVVDGRASIKFTTQSGFDSGVRIAAPAGGWDVSRFARFDFRTYSVNATPYGFQGAQPVVVLVTATGTARYTPTLATEMPKNGGAWHNVALAGNSRWAKTATGAPDLKRVTAVEIHQDTWDYGYSVYYDAVRFTGAATAPTPAPNPTTPTTDVIAPKALLYVFDPIVESRGGRRLHEVYGWGDPVTLAGQTAADLKTSSGGAYDLRFVQTQIVDAHPYFTDGFQNTDASFETNWARRDFHDRAMFDYGRFFRENNIAARVDSRQIDEVWIYHPPIAGTWESAMAGQGAFWVNGPTQPGGGARAFVTMGLNYERGVAEALHSYGHRFESTMDHVYRNAPKDATNAWWLFTRTEQNAPGRAGVGNIHYPPNAVRDYDYDNRRAVLSAAADWLNYGKTGRPGTATTWVTSSTWSPTHADPQRDYMNWFYKHVPHWTGVGRDGKLMSWFRYLGDPNGYK